LPAALLAATPVLQPALAQQAGSNSQRHRRAAPAHHSPAFDDERLRTFRLPAARGLR